MSTALIDLGCVFWRSWHMTAEGGPTDASTKALGVCWDIRRRHDDAIICIDSPPYKRSEAWPEYKATRTERPRGAIEMLNRTIERLRSDGMTIAHVDGWEADDVVATLAKAMPDASIYASDKDLLQIRECTDPFSLRTETAESRLGVPAAMVPDYLALVGDASDNVPGAKGIGPKTAVALLEAFGTIDGIYAALDRGDVVKPSVVAALESHRAAHQMSLDLVTLNNGLDVQLDKTEGDTMTDSPEIEAEFTEHEAQAPAEHRAETVRSIVAHGAVIPVEYRRQLEPQGIDEAWRVAQNLCRSRLYQAFATPEQVFAVVMRGRSLGLDASTSLDSINMIKGKPVMSASLIVGLVMASPQCEYMMLVESSATSATWETKRVDCPAPQRRTFTIDEARALGLDGKDNWRKQPAVMLQWRCAAALCRAAYPDVLLGMYASEELE